MDCKKINSTFKEIFVTQEDSILWIHLDNEKARNAISLDMVEDLVSIFTQADIDDSIRVAIITGEGRSFCAGGNVKDMKTKSGMFEGEAYALKKRYIHGIQKIPTIIEKFRKPLIAMVNGAAIGAGCDLAFMCDFRILSEHSKFGETFSKLGLVPGVGGTYFLSRIVGHSKAMEIFLTGDIYSGKQAYDMGLGNRYVESKNLKSETLIFAKKIAANAPAAVEMTKSALKLAHRSDLESQLTLLASYQSIAQRMDDHFEGISALEENRSPNFKGR